MNSTAHLALVDTGVGVVPLLIPNAVMDGRGFYVSYNNHDTGIYGTDTTALVLGQMEKFYILCGDHRAQYQPLIADGFDARLSYFKANLKGSHRYSDVV
jgi:hypothetical protein